jgi:hypothetical protein
VHARRTRGIPERVSAPLLACALLVALVCSCGSSAERGARAPLPEPRAGGDVLGVRLDAARIERWIGAPVPLSGDGAAPATLVRWWTDGCRFCEASLPAVEELRRRYGARGFRTVAVYHPKPPRAVDDADVLSAARERGYAGAVAVDPDWSALRGVWLDTGERGATSVSFLLDRDGAIRFVHPGPDFHPSDEPAEQRQSEDFEALERAILALLDEAGA